jgi:hypothetical protein
MDIDLDALRWPLSIRGINALEPAIKHAIYRSIIPGQLVSQYAIGADDPQRIRIVAPADTRSFETYLFRHPDDQDSVMYVHMADTLNNQIAMLLLVINDVDAPRFNVDVDEAGHSTRFGTLKRNVPEEIRAMAAGLAPGQVRRGLRILSKTIPVFEKFITRTGHDMVIVEPLTYNNAIVYERYGFAYFQGRKRMEWIDEVLRPNGEFFDRFDGSTPFRVKTQWMSVRGRAWAIQDGILGEPFGDIRMYRRLGQRAGINTFPDAIW